MYTDIESFFRVFDHGEMDLQHWLLGLVAILCMVIAIISLVGQLSKLIGKPVAWVRKADEKQKQVQSLQIKFQQLQKQQEQDRQKSIQHDQKIQKRQDQIYKMLINMQIKTMRWQILDFACSLSQKDKSFSNQQFGHIFDTYNEYEQILQENGLTNGKVDVSMDVIRKKYQGCLENGF